jgi:hypothetical protein
MAKAFREEPAANALATPGNVISHCHAWQQVAGQVLNLMAEGKDPRIVNCVYLTGKFRRSALTMLRVTTMMISQLAGDRYRWFNPYSLCRFMSFAYNWASGQPMGTIADAEADFMIASQECDRIMRTAEKDQERGDTGESRAIVPNPNADRNKFCYDELKDATKKIAQILYEVNAHKGWRHFASQQSVYDAADKHARDNELELIRRYPKTRIKRKSDKRGLKASD